MYQVTGVGVGVGTHSAGIPNKVTISALDKFDIVVVPVMFVIPDPVGGVP
jgi:hypothetical protein